VALGLASGLIGAVGIFLATLILLIKGGDPVGPNLRCSGSILSLLGQLERQRYCAHCTVSFPHSPGWSTAFLRNLFVAVYVYSVKLKASLLSINDFIEHQ